MIFIQNKSIVSGFQVPTYFKTFLFTYHYDYVLYLISYLNKTNKWFILTKLYYPFFYKISNLFLPLFDQLIIHNTHMHKLRNVCR